MTTNTQPTFCVEAIEPRQYMSAVGGEDLLIGGTTTFQTSHHTGGVNILLGDGSVRFLKSTVSLATVDKNETITVHGSRTE